MSISYIEAINIQRELLRKVKLEKLSFSSLHYIGGVDVAYDKKTNLSFCAIVLFTYPELKKVKVVFSSETTAFPYIPGLLSFRELPVVENAFSRLPFKPDLLIFDGQGIAHPRRLGLATHAGVVLDLPTIGCAKSRLFGVYEEPGENKGDYSILWPPDRREPLGWVLRSRSRVKPIFISPGHKVTCEDTLKLVLTTLTRYRLPEPTRQAHLEVTSYKKRYLSSL